MTASHHRPGGGFRNPWPTADDRALGGLWKWIRVHRTSTVESAPASDDGLKGTDARRTTHESLVPRAAAGELTMTWIGHSTFLVQIGGMNVLTDPIWSERASPLSFIGPRRHVPASPRFEDLPPIDAVVISHDHYDHLDRATVRRLAERHPNARWFVPLGVARLVSAFGARDVHETDWWEEQSCGALKLTCTPAQHWSGRGAFDRGRSLWCGWTIRADRRAIWFAGDTAFFPDIASIGERLGPFDAMLLPIGGIEPRWYMRRLHLDPGEAVQAFLAVQGTQAEAATFIAMHWGTFRIADEPLTVPPAMLRDAWTRAALLEERLWILAHGETRTLSNPARVPETMHPKPASMTAR